MTKEVQFAYCGFRKTDVDLAQGFYDCIQEKQCFSDEPCPLYGCFKHPQFKDEKCRVVTVTLIA